MNIPLPAAQNLLRQIVFTESGGKMPF